LSNLNQMNKAIFPLPYFPVKKFRVILQSG
jgi:hypothetical protein